MQNCLFRFIFFSRWNEYYRRAYLGFLLQVDNCNFKKNEKLMRKLFYLRNILFWLHLLSLVGRGFFSKVSVCFNFLVSKLSIPVINFCCPLANSITVTKDDYN